MHYLDNSATTELDPVVKERMSAFRDRNFANAGSVHQGGQRVRVFLETAREDIARTIGAEPKELIFTSGGTESNNYALKGYAFKVKGETGSWPVIITNRAEHHAVLHPVEFLGTLGLPIRYVEVDHGGYVTPDALQTILRSLPENSPFLVSVMYANNETGSVNPVSELSEVVRERGGVLHVDAVQALGKLDCNVAATGADMMSFSAHKIHGPKGIGALYVNKETELESLIHGGAQERDRRGGTEPVELVVGFAEAVRLAEAAKDESVTRMAAQRDQLRTLLSDIEGLRFVTPGNRVLPNIVNVTFEDAAELDGEGLIVGMDIRGVAVSNGSACTSGSMQPSHVLVAMGYPAAQARAAVRFSLGRFTTTEDISRGASALHEVVDGMRRGLRA